MTPLCPRRRNSGTAITAAAQNTRMGCRELGGAAALAMRLLDGRGSGSERGSGGTGPPYPLTRRSASVGPADGRCQLGMKPVPRTPRPPRTGGRRFCGLTRGGPSRHIAPAMIPAQKPVLDVLLCAPRGFCAGVVRAIDAVEKALVTYGAPVYVRHEIVHNKYVVEELKRKGAIFVRELTEVPDSGAPVIFSAHGVPKAVPEAAAARRLFAIDATCPLVTKVHREAEVHLRRGRHVILIGHAGHPEVVGTLGQLPPGGITLVESLEDIAALPPANPATLAYVTQTTLSVDDTREL